MIARTVPLLLVAICCAYAESPAEQRAIIERVRENALNYNERLQDFTCTQYTIRSTDHGSNGRKWSKLDTQELEVSMVKHLEHYRLLKVNDKSDHLEQRIKGGYFRPGGEFGSSIRKIFEPKARARFEWDHSEDSAPGRVCVFRYQVPEESTTMAMQVNRETVPMAHHGLIRANCETGDVLHAEVETEPAWATLFDPPREVGAQLEVDYAVTVIGGRTFLLPSRAIEIARFDKTLTKAEIRFDQYRKYEADSSIHYDVEGK